MNINKIGLGGLNTFDSPDNINDTELAKVRNMVFDDGILQPRMGSLLVLEKPTGETGSPFQLLVATNSNGVDFLIANYGTNFYLQDVANKEWIKLNQSYTPATGGVFYGSANWNNGMKDDRFYFGDGVTDTMKWIMSYGKLKVATTASDTTITLDSSISFPSSGNLIIQNGNSQILLAYSANNTTTGVITITGSVGSVVVVGASVVTPIIDASSVPKGCVFIKAFDRLFVMNSVGYENKTSFSQSNDPENYAVTTDMKQGGSFVLYAGKGGILGASSFGTELTILKQDIFHKVVQNIASDNSSFVFQIIPVLAGEGIGPANDSEILNYMNTLYFPTVDEGIMSFVPQTTGTNNTSKTELISDLIKTSDLDFTLSRTCGKDQKLYWLVSLPTIGTKANVNNLVLMFDLVRAGNNNSKRAWTIFDNWNAVDIKPSNNVLYFLSANDGNLYTTEESYQDAVAGEPKAYTSYAVTKKFNMNSPSTLFRGIYLYVEGIVSFNTTFYIKALFNENGSLGSQPYEIKGTNTKITSNSFTGGMGSSSMAQAMLGGLDLQTLQQFQSPLFFRAYLELSQAFREHNLQVEIFANEIGSQYGISSMSIISVPEQSVETSLVLSPSSAPLINL